MRPLQNTYVYTENICFIIFQSLFQCSINTFFKLIDWWILVLLLPSWRKFALYKMTGLHHNFSINDCCVCVSLYVRVRGGGGGGGGGRLPPPKKNFFFFFSMIFFFFSVVFFFFFNFYFIFFCFLCFFLFVCGGGGGGGGGGLRERRFTNKMLNCFYIRFFFLSLMAWLILLNPTNRWLNTTSVKYSFIFIQQG